MAWTLPNPLVRALDEPTRYQYPRCWTTMLEISNNLVAVTLRDCFCLRGLLGRGPQLSAIGLLLFNCLDLPRENGAPSVPP
mmetsp:Transcript_7154/g.11878  ORF Transcript_7154/g.11878 Transcript_7154/m.11878 type:complete len:81 (+) Transcript_7154:153-395(+)